MSQLTGKLFLLLFIATIVLLILKETSAISTKPVAKATDADAGAKAAGTGARGTGAPSTGAHGTGAHGTGAPGTGGSAKKETDSEKSNKGDGSVGETKEPQRLDLKEQQKKNKERLLGGAGNARVNLNAIKSNKPVKVRKFTGTAGVGLQIENATAAADISQTTFNYDTLKLAPFYPPDKSIRNTSMDPAMISDLQKLAEVLNSTRNTIFGSNYLVFELFTFFQDLENIVMQLLFIFLVFSSLFHVLGCCCVGCCACYIFKNEVRNTLKFAKIAPPPDGAQKNPSTSMMVQLSKNGPLDDPPAT